MCRLTHRHILSLVVAQMMLGCKLVLIERVQWHHPCLALPSQRLKSPRAEAVGERARKALMLTGASRGVHPEILAHVVLIERGNARLELSSCGDHVWMGRGHTACRSHSLHCGAVLKAVVSRQGLA